MALHQYTTFHYHRETTTIMENPITLQGRMISLLDARRKLQYKMGILRCVETPDMNDEQLQRQLINAQASIPYERSTESLLEAVKTNQTTRYLKVWHDHGKIAGNGHLLVLVVLIYDQAFFYTMEEMAERRVTIDVPTAVEEPHQYLLARSGSSDAEQGMYNEERYFDLLTLGEKVTTPDGKAIQDVLHFFHGDSPAAQFECGHNRAGHYICTSSVSEFDDIRTSYRSSVVDLNIRQSSILRGITWKTSATPFEGLKVEELHSEFKNDP